MEAVARVTAGQGASDSNSLARRERVRRTAELAEREISSGFPMIHSQATVTLWGALEDLVRTFVATWFQQVPGALLKPPISRVKVELGDYESLSTEEKGLFVADCLDRSMSGPLKQGVNRFEALLEPIGLSGIVPEDVRRNIFELAQIRHVIAHRRGVADRRLLDACPWLAIPFGLADHCSSGRPSPVSVCSSKLCA